MIEIVERLWKTYEKKEISWITVFLEIDKKITWENINYYDTCAYIFLWVQVLDF